jgi:two-component system sensor histidine kinase KdpD
MNDVFRRPNPDELLVHVQAETQRAARGRLKIFLGYAAGVGKTYAMLEAAHQRKAEGVDLVAAYVETHGRAETEAMLQDLEVIPRRQVEYRGILLQEMDVDAVLVRHPQLALVDELAHTNAPGSRHAKRYQDVEDILAQEIDVYTTPYAKRSPIGWSPKPRRLNWRTCRLTSCCSVSGMARSTCLTRPRAP